MFDGSLFQLATQDVLFRATCVAAALLLFVTGIVAVVSTVLHIRSDRHSRRQAAVEREWRPVIYQALAGRVNPELAAAKVKPDERNEYLRLLLIMARQLGDRDATVLKHMAAPFLDEAREHRRLEAPEVRAQRIQMLGWLGEKSDVARLIDALEDPSPLVAIVALRALIRRQETSAVEYIVENLDRFRFWNARTIASLLADFGAAIAPRLRDLVIDTRSDLRVRLIALTTLQEIGGEIALQTAVTLLRCSRDRAMITGSLRILEAWGDERHLPLLRSMIRSDDEVVRLRALGALSAVDSKSDASALEDALRDRNTWVAMRAAQALIRAGRQDVVERAAAGTSARAELARQVLSEQWRFQV